MDEVGKAKVFAWGEGFAERCDRGHAVGPEVAVVVAGAAPGDEVPALQVVDEAERLDRSLGDLRFACSTILKAQRPPVGERLLEEAEVGLHGQAGVGGGGHAKFQAGYLLLTVTGEDGSNLEESRVHLGSNGLVGELLHQHGGGDEGTCLLGGEVDRREVVALHEGVADACLGGDGHSGLSESGEIAVDGADAQFEVPRHLLGGDDAPGLQIEDQRQETIDSIHRVNE